jgi:hypothetical protein
VPDPVPPSPLSISTLASVARPLMPLLLPLRAAIVPVT